MPTTITSTQLRDEIRDVLNRVEYNQTHFSVVRRGRVAAVLVPLSDYAKLDRLLERREPSPIELD